MACPNAGEMCANGDWFEAIQCWLTAGGDPALQVVVPSAIYGTILMSYFIVGSSPLIPVVISVIFAGIMFAAFPGAGLQIVVITILTVLAVAGVVLTWRFGR